MEVRKERCKNEKGTQRWDRHVERMPEDKRKSESIKEPREITAKISGRIIV